MGQRALFMLKGRPWCFPLINSWKFAFQRRKIDSRKFKSFSQDLMTGECKNGIWTQTGLPSSSSLCHAQQSREAESASSRRNRIWTTTSLGDGITPGQESCLACLPSRTLKEQRSPGASSPADFPGGVGPWQHSTPFCHQTAELEEIRPRNFSGGGREHRGPVDGKACQGAPLGKPRRAELMQRRQWPMSHWVMELLSGGKMQSQFMSRATCQKATGRSRCHPLPATTCHSLSSRSLNYLLKLWSQCLVIQPRSCQGHAYGSLAQHQLLCQQNIGFMEIFLALEVDTLWGTDASWLADLLPWDERLLVQMNQDNFRVTVFGFPALVYCSPLLNTYACINFAHTQNNPPWNWKSSLFYF